MTEVLTERELRALMNVIEDGRRDVPTEGLPWAVLDDLARLVGCDNVSFPESDLTHGRLLFDQSIQNGERELEHGNDFVLHPPEFYQYRKMFLPISYAQRTGDLRSVLLWSDFYTPTQLRGTPLYAEYYRPLEGKHGMVASLPTLPGQSRMILLFRDTGSDFTERDRLVIQLLRPHLHEVYLDAQRRRHHVPELTRREWDVLRLVHRGCSNADIAHELFISVATVRKHLEHIFDRTGVRTRTAAAALMLPHDTVPPR